MLAYAYAFGIVLISIGYLLTVKMKRKKKPLRYKVPAGYVVAFFEDHIGLYDKDGNVLGELTAEEAAEMIRRQDSKHPSA